MEAILLNRLPAVHTSFRLGRQRREEGWRQKASQKVSVRCSCKFGSPTDRRVHAGSDFAGRKHLQAHTRKQTVSSSVISPEKSSTDVKTDRSRVERSPTREESREGRNENLLRPLKPRGSITLPEQQIVLDPYGSVSDSDSDSDTELTQTKRNTVNPPSEKLQKGSSKASDEASKPQEEKKGKGLGQGFKEVKRNSEGLLSESVAKLTEALEQLTGGRQVAGVPAARVIAKGISGAVKGGCAASMAESVGMHVGGGAIEVAALRGAMTGAIADMVSLFIDPPAQEIGEDAVEKGEQAAEELEARLRQKSGGTMIIKREKTVDGSMGKIVGTEKKKKSKKKKKGEDAKPEKSEEEKNEDKSEVHADKTASEGVKEEGMVWGQMEEREETTAVSVVGNAVDLGTKAISGAMKGAIMGAAQEAANNGFVPHGVAKGAISGAFGDTIASRVDPLAKKSQESIKGRDKKDEKKGKKGTIRRKVPAAEQETKVLRDSKTKAIDEGPESKEDRVTEVRETENGKQVKVRSGATLQVVQGKNGESEEVPFNTDRTLGAASKESGLERAVKAGKEREKEAQASGEEEEKLSAIDESFQSGLEAVPEDVIPKQGPAFAGKEKEIGDLEPGTKKLTEDSKPGTKKVEKEGGKVTGAQLARPQSKSMDGLKVKSDHGCADLDLETGFGGSEVVIEDTQLAERIEAEEGIGVEVEGGVDNPVTEQLVLLNEKGVQLRKQERGFWTEEQQAEAEKTALKKLTRALGGAVKGAATGAMTEMATTGTFSGIGAVKGAVGGAVADLAADVADPIAEQVGKEDSDSDEEADVEGEEADVSTNGKADVSEEEADVEDEEGEKEADVEDRVSEEEGDVKTNEKADVNNDSRKESDRSIRV